MGNGNRRAERPGINHAHNHHHQAKHAIDRELLELERKKMVELRRGTVTLTLAGYQQLVKRFGRRS
jgi:hypothetical protein